MNKNKMTIKIEIETSEDQRLNVNDKKLVIKIRRRYKIDSMKIQQRYQRINKTVDILRVCVSLPSACTRPYKR